MVALQRKRKAGTPEANGKSKKLKTLSMSSSNILHSYSRLPTINELPKVKTVPLDVFVWGTGSMCELGLGPKASTKEVKRPRLNPFLSEERVKGKIVDFAAGGMHTLALDNQNQVWSWGGNDSGVLGRDTSKVKEQLKDIKQNGADDEDEDDDGDLNEAESTPYPVEGLPKDKKVLQLCATDNLSAVLLDSGEVYAWGCFRNNEGLLGFLRDEIKLQRIPLKIDQLQNIVQLAGGKDHILALDSKGIVYAWGNGQQFQLGRKILERHRYKALEPQQFGLYNIKYIASGDFHCFAIDHDNNVFAWGLNQFGQCALTNKNGELEDGSLITKPTLIEPLSQKGIEVIAGGEHHTLALTTSGEVFGWGRCDMKEVGIVLETLPDSKTFKDQHGNIRSIPHPVQLVIGNKDVKCKSIGTGSHHSFAVTDDGFVYSWGFADTYGPGLGPLDEDVEKPTRIVNTATKFYDISLVGAGGQFSISGGVKIEDEDQGEDRLDKYEEIDEE